MKLDTWLEQVLAQRQQQNLFRELRSSAGLVDFCSNDYLGLARSEELYDQILERCRNLSIKQNGSTGSRLLSGNSEMTEALEHKLASVFKCEAVLILNSGYSGNLAIFSSIPQKNDTIMYDEFVHASIKDGSRLSLSRRYSFRHNDLNDLELKIKRAAGRVFIAVESVYSMDGDECPLQEMTALANKYGAFVILDEAHSTGTRGALGSGLATTLEVEKSIDVRLYTFGKALGTHGACIAGSKKLIHYLINFARPFIYTTALTPHGIVSIDCAFDYLKNNIQLQGALEQSIQTFVNGIGTGINRTSSSTAIQTMIIPGNDNVKAVGSNLQKAGFDIRPILSPTVASGSERLRICLHTYNSRDEIVKLTTELKKL